MDSLADCGRIKHEKAVHVFQARRPIGAFRRWSVAAHLALMMVSWLRVCKRPLTLGELTEEADSVLTSRMQIIALYFRAPGLDKLPLR